MRRKVILISALVFLFGQIVVLEIANVYFGFNISDAFVVAFVWASAILCGLYSHWAIVYLHKKPEVMK